MVTGRSPRHEREHPEPLRPRHQRNNDVGAGGEHHHVAAVVAALADVRLVVDLGRLSSEDFRDGMLTLRRGGKPPRNAARLWAAELAGTGDPCERATALQDVD